MIINDLESLVPGILHIIMPFDLQVATVRNIPEDSPTLGSVRSMNFALPVKTSGVTLSHHGGFFTKADLAFGAPLALAFAAPLALAFSLAAAFADGFFITGVLAVLRCSKASSIFLA